MPLIKSSSKKAMSKNIETEMDAGKPQKQSIAIAYDIQRKNKRKKMAFGGKAEATNEPAVPSRKPDDERLSKDEYMADHFADGGEVDAPDYRKQALEGTKATVKQLQDFKDESDMQPKKKMAYGGMAEDDNAPATPARKPDNMRPPEDEYMDDHFAEGGDVEGHYDSIADAILAKKRRATKMADGGMVDLDENAQEEPNNLDDMNFEALKKENYAEEHGLSALDSPEDSAQTGDSREEDEENKHDMVDSIRRKMKAKRGF